MSRIFRVVDLTPARDFFLANIGTTYDPAKETPEVGTARVALMLAVAEQQAKEWGWSVEWSPDWTDSPHDHKYDSCTTEPETCEMAVLCDESGSVLASLGCIDDATDDYRRVVAAELALEAMNFPNG